MAATPGEPPAPAIASRSTLFETALLRVLPRDARAIVEVGCGTGMLGVRYRQVNPFCRYGGIEPNPTLAAVAARRLEAVANRMEDLPFAPGTLDCTIYSNLSLCARDWIGILRHYHQWLAPQGEVVAYVPNLQYWLRLARVLRGQWDAEPEFLSSPHLLHFFTLESAKMAFAAAGLQIFEIQTDYPKLEGEAAQQFEKYLALVTPLMQALGVPAETVPLACRALGFVVRATPQPPPSRTLSVYTYITAAAGCDRVRVLEPSGFLATLPGMRVTSAYAPKPVTIAKGAPNEDKVFIWQRALLLYPKDVAKQRKLIDNDYLIVAEHDDDPYLWPENADNRFLLFTSSHCIQTSTAPLGEHLKQFNPNVRVFRNHLAYLPPPRDYGDRDTVNLFFGALNREQDWQPLLPVLNRVLSELGDRVAVKILHDRQLFEAIATPRKQFWPFSPYEFYHEILHTCDVALLPLQDTQFNRMKSDLKFLECAGHGVAALASPTVYANTIAEGETGLIYRSLDDFEGKLRELLQNADLRQRLGRNAYAWVREHRLLSQHYRERRDWYLEMRSQLPRLNAELRDRCPELWQS